MHPEADAFLDAIFDHPDDDTPRLVYADWLEEHGRGNYAQFIRLQCAAAREKLWSEEANRLWEEIGRVWTRLQEEWWPATREHWLVPRRRRFLASRWNASSQSFVDQFVPGSSRLDAIHFERGLLRPCIPVSPDLLLRLAFHNCSLGPITSFLITFDNSALESVAELPQLRWVTRVMCPVSWRDWNYIQPFPSAINEFLSSRHLYRVKVLGLDTFSLLQENVPVLLNAPNLASVGELHVNFGGESDCDPEETVLLLKSRFKRVVRV
jgi:uncharacterized protein (TIGR02996 family)